MGSWCVSWGENSVQAPFAVALTSARIGICSEKTSVATAPVLPAALASPQQIPQFGI